MTQTPTDEASAHRFAVAVEKYLFNPPMRFGLRLGIAPRNFALLETVGRRSGLPRHTPVGGALVDGSYWLVAERGRRCDYVRNLLAEPRVRVLLGRDWYEGSAVTLPDDDGWQRRARLDGMHGLKGRMDGAVFRSNATDPLTVRVDLDVVHR